jgi:hypothetical protein
MIRNGIDVRAVVLSACSMDIEHFMQADYQTLHHPSSPSSTHLRPNFPNHFGWVS